MDDTPAYPLLFSPMQVGRWTLKNRIVHASISLRYKAQGGMHPSYLQYYLNRARGGAAMVIADPVAFLASHGSERVCVWNDSAVDDLTRFAQAIREQDCHLLAQIQDNGRARRVPGRVGGLRGASALPDDLFYSMPEELAADELTALVEAAADAAARLQRCGYTGVEMVAAHGHLFHQFLSPRTNQREDDYGGDLPGRAHLLVQVCQAIRSRCGDGFMMAVKLPGDDGLADGVGPDLAEQIARHLVSQVGVDMLSYSQGTHHHTLEMHLPDDSYPRLPYMPLIRCLQAATPGVPVMALGRVTDPAEAEGILSRGDAALVGLARALVTDPTWPLKASQGRARDIRYCVSCNSCWRTIIQGQPLACDNNPRVAQANELDDHLPAASSPGRIVVLGAGIAGLEAAMTAAGRGHQVTVFGHEAGGKAQLQSRLRVSESLSSIADYQLMQLQKQGVHLRLGAAARVEDVQALQPDAVVLATGATMVWPQCLPERLREEGWVKDLREVVPDVLAIRDPQPGTAVLFDMDQTEGTYAAAELLRDKFARVVVLCAREAVAQDVALVVRQRVQRRFVERSIEVIPQVEPVWTESMEDEGRLAYRSVFGGALHYLDDVVLLTYATPRRPNLDMLPALQALGVPVHRIGDAKWAREPMSATAEGYAIGMAL
ncbi:MAG: FAD-dependent oxidoreductase [Betaproteobacteria bacterium]